MAVHGKAPGTGLSGPHTRIAAILRQPAVVAVVTFAAALAAALGMWHFVHDAGRTVLIPSLAGALLLAGIMFLVARDLTGTPEAIDPARTRSTLNEARLTGIIRSSMEAIITIDESQHIVIFNPMAEQVFGCSAMEATGANRNNAKV